ncbi:MAG: tRNA (guanosine(37)-N1)-methyltransferase TrmD [Candidatus Methylomirabilia bacterium]
MRIDILTIFPSFFDSPLRESIIHRACERGVLDIRVHDLRAFALDRHRVTDDAPYGGGAGMVMKPEPLFAAIEHLKAENPGATTVLLSPQGRVWSQPLVREFGERLGMILVCGRYEGVDERVRVALIDEEISIGDYVLAGGETAAMVLLETVARQVPGVVGQAESVEQDSFYAGLLDHPHYTRPPVFRGLAVPEVLLSGDHAAITRWRRREALRQTLRKRPDLLAAANLCAEDVKLLEHLGGTDDDDA